MIHNGSMRARPGQLSILSSPSFQYRRAQCLVAKSAAVVDLTYSSMTRTSSVTIWQRPLGSCAQIQRCTLTPGPLLSLCTAPILSYVGRLAPPSIATRLSVHVRLDFTLGYISKTCRISHGHWNHYKNVIRLVLGYVSKNCFPLTNYIWRVCY